MFLALCCAHIRRWDRIAASYGLVEDGTVMLRVSIVAKDGERRIRSVRQLRGPAVFGCFGSLV